MSPLVCLANLHALLSFSRVEWGEMSMVGQSESDDVFVSGVTVKELMITGSSLLPFLFHSENKKVGLITMGSLIFGRQMKMPSHLLCPPYLLFPTLP